VNCHFFLTGLGQEDQAGRDLVQEKIYGMLQGIDKRNSAFIREEAAGDAEIEKELRRENEDGLAALPNAYTASHISNSRHYQPPPTDPHSGSSSPGFDFGFGKSLPPVQTTFASRGNTTPRYAYYQPPLRRENWKTDYFRPNISQILMDYSKNFGRRACVFVCGPPSMRVEVASTVARLQTQVMFDSSKDEIFLHAENYNI
jgi:hypothetical protein